MTVNSDQMFELWSKNSEEIRRTIMGKYQEEHENKEINIAKIISKYNGPSICSKKFDFQPEGNKCSNCNTLSFLFKDGNIIKNSSFVIQAGKFVGKKIIVKNYPRDESFSWTTSKTPEDLHQYLPTLTLCESVFSKIQSSNKVSHTNQIYHIMTLSLLLNYIFENDERFRNRFLYVYLCDDLNIVSWDNESLQSIVEKFSEFRNGAKVLNKDVTRGIFIQLIYYFFFLATNGYYYIHGSPSMSYISFVARGMAKNVSFENKKTSFQSPVILSIDPGKYSSLIIDNYSKGKNHYVYDQETSPVFTPINVSFSLTPSSDKKTSTNPCLEEYIKYRQVTYRLNHNIINFTRSTGINVFSSIDHYLFIITLLLEKEFFIPAIEDSLLLNIFHSIFGNQYSHVISEIQKVHMSGKKYDSEQIVNFVISLNIDLKCSIILDVWKEIVKNL
jgi:hypothetical protein